MTCWIPAPQQLALLQDIPTYPIFHLDLHSLELSQRLFLPPETLTLTQAASRMMNEKYLFPARLWILLGFPQEGI